MKILARALPISTLKCVLPRIRHFLNSGSDVAAQIYSHPSHHNLTPLDLLLCRFMKDIIYHETVKHLWEQTTHHTRSSTGKKLGEIVNDLDIC
jgi:hypothetical protein